MIQVFRSSNRGRAIQDPRREFSVTQDWVPRHRTLTAATQALELMNTSFVVFMYYFAALHHRGNMAKWPELGPLTC